MKYFILTIRHKFWVLYYGIKIGCPLLRLITHDISKLGWKEYPYYQQQFFGDKSDQDGFQKAWNHHHKSNDHHWEYHVPITRHDRGTPRGNDLDPLPMSKGAMLEMISDWMGAHKNYTGEHVNLNDWGWFDRTWPKISPRMHKNTRSFILRKLSDMGRVVQVKYKYEAI